MKNPHLFAKGRTCATCAVPVNDRCKTGMCRSCSGKARHADPEWKARQDAALKASAASPESRARKSAAASKHWSDPNRRVAMSEAKKRAMADPVKRAAVASAAAETLRNWHATTDRDWSAWHKARAAKKLAWCPEDRRDEYRRLSRQFGAVEARRIITDDMVEIERRRIAAMSPFERQMERLRNGAKLVEVRPLRRADHDFTLGGIAPEAM